MGAGGGNAPGSSGLAGPDAGRTTNQVGQSASYTSSVVPDGADDADCTPPSTGVQFAKSVTTYDG